MTEGIVRIYLSYVEPEDKGLLWMRPYLHKEGYELLYFGAKGWTRWIPCCPPDNNNIPGDNNTDETETLPENPSNGDLPCECLK